MHIRQMLLRNQELNKESGCINYSRFAFVDKRKSPCGEAKDFYLEWRSYDLQIFVVALGATDLNISKLNVSILLV